ncbi:MAG: hypothetical protein ACM35G_01780 [Planctomycetaceae bacterium]
MQLIAIGRSVIPLNRYDPTSNRAAEASMEDHQRIAPGYVFDRLTVEDVAYERFPDRLPL